VALTLDHLFLLAPSDLQAVHDGDRCRGAPFSAAWGVGALEARVKGPHALAHRRAKSVAVARERARPLERRGYRGGIAARELRANREADYIKLRCG
jgi:hypothetical protein